MTNDIKDLREDYSNQEFNLESDIKESNAMTLSTSVNDIVSARIVLLKEITEHGFIFYTNRDSDKGRQMKSNSNVALTFLWKELEKQIRIQGIVSQIDEAHSIKYFQSRPKGSQIGTWASDQSKIIADRSDLDMKKQELEKKYLNDNVLPKPDNWGGYLVRPKSIEFWKGREDRLHDRLKYTIEDETNWRVDRLSP